MASGDGYAELDANSDTLSPLPSSHRDGLIAVSTFGFLSFVSTTTLFLYLTYKMVAWQLKQSRAGVVAGYNHDPSTNTSIGMSREYIAPPAKPTAQPSEPQLRPTPSAPRKPLNQFLLLVYSLLFAEMHQSLAFLLNSPWVASNAILVGTSTCWVQGWFVSVGDLSVSCFISAIAVHTYLTVVRGYKPRQWMVYTVVGGLWVFAYALAIIGILVTNNGRSGGGLYVRATGWCWMNVKYERLRLWLHYFWIFLSLGLTSCLYVLIFFTLWRRNRSSQHHFLSHAPNLSVEAVGSSSRPEGKHPGFLVYPVIYVLCTAPLALGRVAAMAQANVSAEYFCLAGSMIASNGWLDVLLFSWTRRSVIFGSSPDSADVGLGTFTFLRTPHERRYGNMVWVQGAALGGNESPSGPRPSHRGWWKLGSGPVRPKAKGRDSNGWADGSGEFSRESLRATPINDHGIQLDTITTVVVELDTDRKEPASSVHRRGSTEL